MKCINICQGVRLTEIHKVLLCICCGFLTGKPCILQVRLMLCLCSSSVCHPPNPRHRLNLKLMKNNLKVCEYMKNRLQEMRWEKNWSQTQLAMKSNVSHSTISLIENNPLENPHVYTAIKLAHALGVSVEDIFIL